MSSTVTMISGRQPQRGQMVIIRGSMPLIRETRRGLVSVLETEIQALPLTKKAIADAFGDRFFAALDFELLESHMPFYQSALGDWLGYDLTFNNYNRVIQADVDASYLIGGISLEFDMVTLPELSRMINNQYKGRLAILYDRVLWHRKMTMDKSSTLLNINLNIPARSMEGILMLFENAAAQQPFARNTEAFYNPKITKVEVQSRGSPANSTVKGCAPIRCGTRQRSTLRHRPAVSVTPK